MHGRAVEGMPFALPEMLMTSLRILSACVEALNRKPRLVTVIILALRVLIIRGERTVRSGEEAVSTCLMERFSRDGRRGQTVQHAQQAHTTAPMS